MRVAVLGCGPAGLMAAHAVTIQGAEISIFSQGSKSPIYGAQYLHKPIPYVTNKTSVTTVGYSLNGTAEEYRAKVYGGDWTGPVSPEDLPGVHDAWDLRSTYDGLWQLYRRAIAHTELNPYNLTHILDGAWDLVINSIPRETLCLGGHNFAATEIWAAGDAPDLGIKLPYSCPNNTVLCNGKSEPAWYRLSNIYGHKTVEWPGSIDRKPPVSTCSKVRKPTWHNCDCWSNEQRLIHVGRYGRWEKGYLSHEAFADAGRALIRVRSKGKREEQREPATEAGSGS